MGFCLFEQVIERGFYFAVNVSHIDDIIYNGENKQGEPICELKLSCPLGIFTPLVVGALEDVQALLMSAAKIGLRKIEIDVIGSAKPLSSTNLLLNQPDRVFLVREMLPDEFEENRITTVTASEMFMSGGKRRFIMQRPGLFALKANANNKVPVMEGSDDDDYDDGGDGCD